MVENADTLWIESFGHQCSYAEASHVYGTNAKDSSQIYVSLLFAQIMIMIMCTDIYLVSFYLCIPNAFILFVFFAYKRGRPRGRNIILLKYQISKL